MRHELLRLAGSESWAVIVLLDACHPLAPVLEETGLKAKAPTGRTGAEGPRSASPDLLPMPRATRLLCQGMGVDFTIEEKAGPKIPPMRTWEAVSPAVVVARIVCHSLRQRALSHSREGYSCRTSGGSVLPTRGAALSCCRRSRQDAARLPRSKRCVARGTPPGFPFWSTGERQGLPKARIVRDGTVGALERRQWTASVLW